MLIEHPVGIAGVTPTMRGFFGQVLKEYVQTHLETLVAYCYCLVLDVFLFRGMNLPGACQTVALFSAGS